MTKTFWCVIIGLQCICIKCCKL